MDKAELIQQLDQSHARMHAVLDGIDPQLRLSPTWTIKEAIAHIAGWDDLNIEMLRAHATGEPYNAPEWLGIDHYNAQTVETRHSLSYEQTIAEWERTRLEFKSAILAIPPDKLDVPLMFLWGYQGTTAQLVAIMAHHENGHAAKIEQQKAIPPQVF